MKVTTDVLSHKTSQENFVKIFSGVHGVSAERAQQMFDVEKFNFLKIIHDRPELSECTEISQRGVFLDVISAGLSFSPASGLVYVKGRNRKTGAKDANGRDIYENVMEFQPSPKGKVYLCQRVNSIERITEPTPVYSDDYFKQGTDKNGKWVEHIPSEKQSGHVVACYCFIVYPGGQREPVVLTSADIERRKRASEIQNGKRINGVFQPGEANRLYTSFRGGIDPGFFGAKVIDAATKYLRKQEINSIFAGSEDEPENIVYDADASEKPGTPPSSPAEPVVSSAPQKETPAAAFADIEPEDDTF